MVAPKAVIFDWGGTLTLPLDPHYFLTEVWSAAASHLSSERARELAAHLKSLETEVWEVSRHEHRSSRIEDQLRSAAEEFRLEIAETVLEEATQKHLAGVAANVRHDPEAAPVLTRLRDRGLKTGLLSNTTWPAAFHDELLEEEGLLALLDARFYTSDLSVTKPHPDAFRAVVEALGVEPEAAVFVGDRPWDDIYGAKRAGLRAVLRPSPVIPHEESEPDATIRNLPELVPIIDGWLKG
jgi:putative hydrolase of the HAD superfamily